MIHLYKLLSSRLTIAALLLCTLGFIGCTETEDELSSSYGYVQFKLYKNDTAPTSRATTLDYLHDAHKVQVTMQHDDRTIVQTLVLNAYNSENSEYGLRSDKLQLLVGEYRVIGYTLYDRLDNELLSASAHSQFTIIADGLVMHNLSVSVTPRGKAAFRLVKPENFSATRATEAGAYPFGNIKAVSFTVKNINTTESTDINKVLVTLEEGFLDHSIDGSEYNAQTTSFSVDTVVWLKEGTYTVSRYTTYADKNARNVLEAVEVTDGVTFEVRDNELTDSVAITIQLSETAEHIKDYLALKEIWLALDGPNWSYYGEA